MFEIQLWEEQPVTKGEDDTTKDKSEMDEVTVVLQMKDIDCDM